MRFRSLDCDGADENAALDATFDCPNADAPRPDARFDRTDVDASRSNDAFSLGRSAL